jgi:low affinity Fe/Cu permease
MKAGLILEIVSGRVTDFAASSAGLTAALSLVIGYLLLGLLCHFSQDWQNYLSAITTLFAFLMVFLLQRAQNKSTEAIHLKLNELIASHNGASNRFLNIEHNTDDELAILRDVHQQLPIEPLESLTQEHIPQSEIILPNSNKLYSPQPSSAESARA